VEEDTTPPEGTQQQILKYGADRRRMKRATQVIFFFLNPTHNGCTAAIHMDPVVGW